MGLLRCSPPKKNWWRSRATALELPSTRAQASAIRTAVPAASGRRRVGAVARVSPGRWFSKVRRNVVRIANWSMIIWSSRGHRR